MDPVTHGVSGLIGANFLKLKFALPTRYGWLFLLGAVFPDIDNVAGFLGREAYILHHRGITHSLIFALLFPAVVASILKLLSPRWNFFLTWITLSASMALHIFFDIITSYGTQILTPFSRHRFALDWVFIVDPFFTGIMLLLILLSRWKSTITTVAALVLFFYPFLCGAMKGIAEGKVRSTLGFSSQVHIVPEFGTPFYWKVIKETPTSYGVVRYSLLTDKLEGSWHHFAKTNLLERSDKPLPKALKTYKWFAVFPFQFSSDNPHRRLVLGDLRFVSTWRISKSELDVPFSLVVKLDANGKIEDAHFAK